MLPTPDAQSVKPYLIPCFRHEKKLKKERIKKTIEYEKELDGVKNMIDCQGYRENECRKYSYEFKRDVVNRPKPVSSRYFFQVAPLRNSVILHNVT